MRVALCTDYFYPTIGGVQSHVAGLASELDKRGHEVIIIAKKAGVISHEHLARIRCGNIVPLEPIFPLPVIIVPPILQGLKRCLRRKESA
ncbi:MAG: glycosyltransferase [Nitrososphaerota archaeon]|nr:glycosyltransferase [Candidatus Bathyarchaeota archaeon]MDW8049045.1 glycosyltransferase [Nitrososphaerota archaeon]